MSSPLPPSSELPNDSQEIAVMFAGAGREVLELGCGAGHVTQRMVANGCRVTGVEIDPAAAEEARKHAASVHVADLDVTPISDLLEGVRFDRIVIGDVFEHLKNPEAVLSDLAKHLTGDGYLVTSIPNVTHADVRLMLLSGTWQYQDSGLLDRTHLRMFDLAGVLSLFEDSGWRIDRLERTTKRAGTSELAPLVPREVSTSEVMAIIDTDPDSTTYQFVVVARPGKAEAGTHDQFMRSGSRRSPSTGANSEGRERLLHENERLRVRVRELEERLEDLQWVRAMRRKSLHRPLRKARAWLSAKRPDRG